MRISDWSSDVCSSDLQAPGALRCERWRQPPGAVAEAVEPQRRGEHGAEREGEPLVAGVARGDATEQHHGIDIAVREIGRASCRERVCQDVYISVVALSLKKKIIAKTTTKPTKH